MKLLPPFLCLSLVFSAAADELGRIETEQTKAARQRHREKLNPASDGWDTEAFSNAAQAKLNELGELLCSPELLTTGSLAEIVAPGAVTKSLFPTNKFKEVYTRESLKVKRLDPDASLISSRKILDALNALAGNFENARYKFKRFKVEPINESQTRTRQFLALSDEQRELNATWSIVWENKSQRIKKP